MRSVGGCSVRSAWRNMEGRNLAPTAGANTHSTLKTIEVSLRVGRLYNGHL